MESNNRTRDASPRLFVLLFDEGGKGVDILLSTFCSASLMSSPLSSNASLTRSG